MMSFTVLPDVDALLPVNRNIRFLERCAVELQDFDQSQSPPLLHLMEVLREGFADGCSVTILGSKDTQHGSGGVAETLLQEMGDLEREPVKEKLVYDHAASVSYLALPMVILPGVRKPHILLLWRKDRVFSPDDVITARLVLRLFGSRFRATEIEHWLSMASLRGERAIAMETDVEMYKNALNAVPDVVLVCALSGRVLGMNFAAQSCFGEDLQAMTQAPDNSWMASISHPDDLKDLLSAWSSAAEDLASKKIGNKKHRKFLLRFVPIFDHASGKLLNWVIVVSDLEIAESLDEVRSMAQMKGRFLAEISHEIRTPLACVLGTATLLSHTKLDPDQEELLKTITISSQQLSNLISNVLDLSRIEENKLVLEKAPMKIEKIIVEIMEQFRTDLARMKLEPIISIDLATPFWIISDELRVRQIVSNLVSNAIKFSRPNGIVAVRVKSFQDGRQKMLEVRVEDEGIGISEASSKKLFESFNQLETSTTRKYGGSGLGLVISKKLVELLGGTIGLASEQGKDTTFFFSIPYDVPTEPQISAAVRTGFVSVSKQLSELEEALAGRSDDCSKPHIILAMSHPKVSVHIKGLLERLPQLTVSDQKEKEGAACELGCTLLITDDVSVANSAALVLADAHLVGIIYTDYDFSPSLQAKGIEFIRKPLRERQLLVAIQNALSNVPSNTAQVNNRTQATPMRTSFAIAERYPLRILIAEDDLLNQRLLERILEKFGYGDLVMVGDGKEAVSTVQEAQSTGNPFQLIFMDMEMPELDGCEASREIRSEARGPHIVAMTANAFTEDREKCLAAGMCEYASKPVKWELLEEILKRAHLVATGQLDCRCRHLLSSLGGNGDIDGLFIWNAPE